MKNPDFKPEWKKKYSTVKIMRKNSLSKISIGLEDGRENTAE